MEINYLECYIVPVVAAITFYLLSLFFFSKNPYIDSLVKAIILAAIIFLACAFLIPSECITVKIW